MEQNATRNQSFEEIMNTYGEEIKRFILMYVRDAAAADDLVQEVFLKVYLNLDTFEDRSGLRTWIYRIAVNQCKDYFRSWHYQRVKLTETFDFLNRKTDLTPEIKLLKKSEDHALAQNILSLSPKYREIILLYYYRDFSMEEIASLLNLKASTVRTRMQRAREQLKKKIEGEDFGAKG
ncbi:sigma-70 family RNA polymerase sigma factor [Camelliibacillus cellulosilyticus]|uniref:RNA polymerase sigma factor n=1 Tax=Camelliibacillus cellulosilyticus TaxID=2174486 RepID=A0ABV9GIR3_9BACL